MKKVCKFCRHWQFTRNKQCHTCENSKHDLLEAADKDGMISPGDIFTGPLFGCVNWERRLKTKE